MKLTWKIVLICLVGIFQQSLCEHGIVIGSAQTRSCSIPYVINGRVNVLGKRHPDGTVTAGSFVVLQCDAGFKLANGALISYCSKDGNWNEFLGECRPQVRHDCSNNIEIANGKLWRTRTIQNFQVRCNDGFILIGAASVYCFSDYSWTKPGQCVPIANRFPMQRWGNEKSMCQIPNIFGATISLNDGPNFLAYRISVPPGVRVKLTCPVGYRPYAKESTCIGGSIWVPSPMKCVPKLMAKPMAELEVYPTTTTTPKPKPTVVSIYDLAACRLPDMTNFGSFYHNGKVLSSTSVPPGTTVVLECNEMLKIRNGVSVSTCFYNSTWSDKFGECYLPEIAQNDNSDAPICTFTRPKNTGVLINNKYVDSNEVYHVRFGTYISTICGNDFVVEGSSKSFCDRNGFLVPPLGKCVTLSTKTVPTTTTQKSIDLSVSPGPSECLFSINSFQ